MTPFFGTPAFLPALKSTEFGAWSKHEHRGLSQVLQSDPLLLASSMSAMTLDYFTLWLQRHHALSYIQSIPTPLDILTEPTNLEYLPIQKEPPTHTISLLYSIFMTLAHPDLPLFTQKWEKDLQQIFNLSHVLAKMLYPYP